MSGSPIQPNEPLAEPRHPSDSAQAPANDAMRLEPVLHGIVNLKGSDYGDNSGLLLGEVRAKRRYQAASYRYWHTLGLAWESIGWWFLVLAMTLVFAAALFRTVHKDKLDSLDRELLYLIASEVKEKIETDLQLGFDLSDDRGAQNLIDELITRNSSIRAVEIFDRERVSLFNTDRGSINERVSLVWLHQAQSASGKYWVVYAEEESVIGLPLRNAYDSEPFGHLAITYARTRVAQGSRDAGTTLTGETLSSLYTQESIFAIVAALFFAIVGASLLLAGTARRVREELDHVSLSRITVDLPLEADDLTQAVAVLTSTRDRIASALDATESESGAR